MHTQAVLQRSAIDRAIEFLSPHCDIAERLPVVPPSARVRGTFLKQIETQVERHGKADFYGRFFRDDTWSAFRPYPLRDYMVRLAVAGAALRGPEHVHAGMHEVWRTNATTFASSLLGRTMLRLLSHDPVRLTEQGLAARRQTYLYGHWKVVYHSPRSIEMVYREEYVWIESAIAGGAVGAFESCGITVNLETKLIDRFNGSTLINW